MVTVENNTDTIPELDIELPEITQVGFVVEDLEDAIERFRLIMGLDSWEVYRFEPPELSDTWYRGEPTEFSMRIAHTYAGETNLEFIEPLSGPNVYADHLDEHGEGIHHLKSSWDEEARTYEVVEAFEDAGIPVLQRGSYMNSEFWYFDTAEVLNGLVFETSIRRMGERTPEYTLP